MKTIKRDKTIEVWIATHALLLMTSMMAPAQVARNYYGARLEPGSGVLHASGQFGDGAWLPYSNTLDADVQPFINHIYFKPAETIGDVQDWADRLANKCTVLASDVRLLISIGFDDILEDGRYMDKLTAEGYYDDQFELVADTLKAIERPVYLRLGFEFEGSWNNYRPDYFKAGFTNITQILRDKGVNTATIWCSAGPSAGAKFNSTNTMLYYPGDSWVDWWGIDLFDAAQFTNSTIFDFFLPEADAHGKPVFIPEATPKNNSVQGGEASWNAWFVPFFDFIYNNPQVKAFAYINADWPTKGWDWGDSRIEENSFIASRYNQKLKNNLFVHSASAIVFNGAQITSNSTWIGAQSVLDTVSGYSPSNYAGQTIYHGFKRDSSSACQVGFVRDGAVAIQWNSTTGWAAGDVSTAVFGFKKDEFWGGFNPGTACMTESNDTLAAKVIYNPRSGALASGSFRWVVEDQGSFYISEATSITNPTTFLSEDALTLSWFDYDPTNDVAAVGSAAVPAFSDLGYIGFQLEAVCGPNGGQQYHRIGVEQFYAKAMVDSGLTAYESWADLFGGTNVIGSADNDYDGDNVSNLGEYAINGNPTNSGDKGQTSISNDGTYFTYIHAKRDGEQSLVYRLLDSADLGSAAVNTNGYVSRSEGPVEGDYLTVTNNYNLTAETLFIKLEVSSNK